MFYNYDVAIWICKFGETMDLNFPCCYPGIVTMVGIVSKGNSLLDMFNMLELINFQ